MILLLAGCTNPEPLVAGEAAPHYDAMVSDLGNALAAQGVVWTLAPASRMVSQRDGRCAYDPGNWMPARTAEGTLRREEGWNPWITAIAPVLAESGFDAVDAPEQAEGVLRVRTTDRHGAELILDMTGQLRIWDATVRAEPCTRASLGL